MIGYLTAQGGSATSRDVWEAGKKEHFSKDQLKRAKGKQVRSAKVADRWVWAIVTDPTSPLPAREQQGSKSAGDKSAAPLLPSLLPSPHACPDHPNDKRAANGKCIGCIADRSNRLTREERQSA
ncbi:hypothetical protein [Modestobacter sp. I12A-02662]|uniref:hypothetical protein n=1 Tax=Modestobacter sp. I12A-02662 TaxID=1730496 RepID=UPI0034DE2676